jgi:shikimate dehydrogenase
MPASWASSSVEMQAVHAILQHAELYGIFGYPIGHSLSPLMHNTAFAHHGLDAVYLPFAVPPAQVEIAVKAIRALHIRGVNVTIPHKQAVMAWLDELSPEARLIGAVNTVQLRDDRLVGYNTDGIGFLRSLEEAGSEVAGRTVLLLGAGGAARALAVQLCLAGIQRLYLANRTQTRAEELAAFLKENIPHADISVVSMKGPSLSAHLPHIDIVVNATSVGMHPHDRMVLPFADLGPRHLVCDIVYRPLHTPLLQAAQHQGARTVDGLGMLIHQGAKAFEIWTQRSFPIPLIRAKLSGALAERSTAGPAPNQR